MPPRRGIPRLLVRAAASLVAGLSVSFIVAQACALRCVGDNLRWSIHRPIADSGAWQEDYPSCGVGYNPVEHGDDKIAELIGLADVSWLKATAPGGVGSASLFEFAGSRGLDRREAVLWPTDLASDSRTLAELTLVRAGWPLRCFEGMAAKDGQNRWITRGAVEAPTTLAAGRGGLGGARLLPLTPLWPGLLADGGLFTAAVLAFMWAAALVRAFHGRLRHDPGRCPACNYHLLGLPPGAPCPECGAPTPPKTGSPGSGRPIVP